MAILTGIDFARDGKQFGHLEIPHSTHRSAYGKIMIPVVHIRNGEGARAMISAGVHGDEYEGQIALRKLALEMSVDDIKGSLILLPSANAPAVEAALRSSPIDGGNLNRLFPGKASGQSTEMIAFAIEHLLLAGCDFAYDIHSGGSSLIYDVVAITTETGTPDDDRARLGVLHSLGLHAGMVLSASAPMGLDASLDGAMLRQNVIGVSAEFGGGGKLQPHLLSQCQDSIQRFLAHTGLKQNVQKVAEARTCALFDVTHSDTHVYSGVSGLFEPNMGVGESVSEGDSLGAIYQLDDCESPPNLVHSNVSGTILCIRATSSVRQGDCLFQIGQPRE
jgi:predicted deacylase